MNVGLLNIGRIPPIDFDAMQAAGIKMMENEGVHEEVAKSAFDAMRETVMAAVSLKQVKEDSERNANFFMIEAYSYYCAPLIDFVGDEFDKFSNMYLDNKAFDDENLKNALNLIWRILSDAHVDFYETATDKEFYQAYRMYCMDYIRQRYNLLVTRLTSIYRESGEKRCRMAAMLSALNAVAVMSDTGRDQIGDSIRSYYKTDKEIEEYSMKNVRMMFDYIIHQLELKFLTKLKPRVDRYLEEFYTAIYVKQLINYGLDHTKERYWKATYDARLHAIDVFGDKIFT